MLLDGTHRDPLQSGNLSVLESFEAAEHEYIPSALGQGSYGRCNLGETFFTL